MRSQVRITAFTASLFLAVVTGLVLGYLAPRRAHATNFWEEWFDIPFGGSNGQEAWLNCGWHTTCLSPYASGSALDWDANADNGAYFAGAAKWDGWYVTNATWVEVSEADKFNGSQCHNSIAYVYNWYTGGLLSMEVYDHTVTDGTTFSVYAYSDPWPIRQQVATAIYPEDIYAGFENCHNSGYHIHGYLYYGGAPNSGGYPDASSCHTNVCRTYPNNTWVHYNSWYY